MGKKQKRKIDRLRRAVIDARAGQAQESNNLIRCRQDFEFEKIQHLKQLTFLKNKNAAMERGDSFKRFPVYPRPFVESINGLPQGRHAVGSRVEILCSNMLMPEYRPGVDIRQQPIDTITLVHERLVMPIGRHHCEYVGWRLPAGVVIITGRL